MTYADSGVEVSEAPLDELVEVDACEVVEAEEGVFSEDGLEPKLLCSHHDCVREETGAGVAVDDVDLLPY